MTRPPTIAQLRNLTDRAATGLSNDEQQRLRDGIDRLERAEAALAEARRIHRQTCPLAQGKVGPGFTCGMCDTLDGERPAAPDGAFAIGAPPGIGVDEARQMRDELLAATRPAEPGGLRARLVDLHARWIAAGPPPLGTSINRWWDRRLAELGAALAEQPGEHVYLSTGCLHGDHAYCQSMTGLNGAKRPASCKKCGAKCICPCHQAEEPPAHNDGPSTAECADADRAWPLQKAGE